MTNFHAEAVKERARVTTINELGRAQQRRDLADVAIQNGWSVPAFQTELLRDLAPLRPLTAVGLSRSEITQYSTLRQLADVGLRPDGPRVGLEWEASAAVAKAIGREPTHIGSFFVPLEIQQRDLTAGVASAGGYLVGSSSGGSFIEATRNRSVARRMGAQTVGGLKGSVPMPKQTGAGTAYWLSTEATQITESQQTFGQVTLTPHTVGAYTELSRQLALQSSPAAEAVVMSDLAADVALAVDSAVINGSGASGQPSGILQTSGIGSVSGASLTYDGCLEFQSDILAANALTNIDTCGYVTTTAVAKVLANRQRFTGTDATLWQGNIADGSIAGFPAMTSGQMPASHLLFGDWSTLLIGEWGVLELMTNPFANFAAGIIGVRAMYTVDIGLRYAASFSLATAVT